MPTLHDTEWSFAPSFNTRLGKPAFTVAYVRECRPRLGLRSVSEFVMPHSVCKVTRYSYLAVAGLPLSSRLCLQLPTRGLGSSQDVVEDSAMSRPVHYRHFKGSQCPHVWGQTDQTASKKTCLYLTVLELLDTKDTSNTVLRNVSKYLPVDAA